MTKDFSAMARQIHEFVEQAASKLRADKPVVVIDLETTRELTIIVKAPGAQRDRKLRLASGIKEEDLLAYYGVDDRADAGQRIRCLIWPDLEPVNKTESHGQVWHSGW